MLFFQVWPSTSSAPSSHVEAFLDMSSCPPASNQNSYLSVEQNCTFSVEPPNQSCTSQLDNFYISDYPNVDIYYPDFPQTSTLRQIAPQPSHSQPDYSHFQPFCPYPAPQVLLPQAPSQLQQSQSFQTTTIAPNNGTPSMAGTSSTTGNGSFEHYYDCMNQQVFNGNAPLNGEADPSTSNNDVSYNLRCIFYLRFCAAKKVICSARIFTSSY